MLFNCQLTSCTAHETHAAWSACTGPDVAGLQAYANHNQMLCSKYAAKLRDHGPVMAANMSQVHALPADLPSLCDIKRPAAHSLVCMQGDSRVALLEPALDAGSMEGVPTRQSLPCSLSILSCKAVCI